MMNSIMKKTAFIVMIVALFGAACGSSEIDLSEVGESTGAEAGSSYIAPLSEASVSVATNCGNGAVGTVTNTGETTLWADMIIDGVALNDVATVVEPGQSFDFYVPVGFSVEPGATVRVFVSAEDGYENEATALGEDCVDPYEEAAAYYLETVAVFNCANARLFDAWDVAPGLEDELLYTWEWEAYSTYMVPIWEELRDIRTDWMSSLGDYDWPEDVQPSIDDLFSELSLEASNYNFYADTPDYSDFRDLTEEIEWPDWSAAAVIRAKLGLPSNIGDDTDYCTYT
jgi:hypothetical protein